jgi:FR47-like protein
LFGFKLVNHLIKFTSAQIKILQPFESFFSYGIYLAQNLSRLVISRGYKPFVVIRHENDASKSLYKKLGFEKDFEVARIVFTPFDQDDKNDDEVSNGKDEISNGKEEISNGKEEISNGKDEISNGNSHESDKENGNHVNGKSNGVNNNHKV